MKLKYNILLILSCTLLNAQELELKNMNFFIENDADFRTDEAYTHGASITALFLRKDIRDTIFHIPFTDYKKQDNYISFAYAQKIYTPQDLESSELIEDDRPYAGYSYIQTALHQSYNHSLKSLTFQIGLVGPSTGMESVQKTIHDIIGSPYPQGWEHQLGDELTIQLNYDETIYIKTKDIYSYKSVVIPNYGFELGNASTKVYTGALFRIGNYIPDDYGSLPLNSNSYNKIPLEKSYQPAKGWNFCFNFSLKANLIARDIFLDGNSNRESHSVDKNNFTINGGYGFSLFYNNFSMDYMHTHTSKEFKEQDYYTGYGSFIFSYYF
jgi:hypothetical protein